MLKWILIIVCVIFIVKGIYGILVGDENATNIASFVISAISFILSFVILPYIQSSGGIIFSSPSPAPTPSETTEEISGEKTGDVSDSGENPEGTNINILTENEWTGVLGEEESKEVRYKPIQSGNYRFDFIDDADTSYRFLIKNSANEEIKNAYSEDGGVTTELEAGQLYTLFVEQYEGDVDFHIKIGVPQKKQEVEGNKIDGKLEYTDQINEYTYIAERTGIYRFDFIVKNVEQSYSFAIFDSKNQEELNKSSSDEGGTVELVENEKYTIQVIQEEGMPEYTINIGVPNAAFSVKNNDITGNIEFVDQQDGYIYQAPRNGTYRFDYKTDDVNTDCKVIIKDERNDVIKQNYCSDEGCTVELEKKKKYYVYVEQETGFAKYQIKIHSPKKTITTQNGNITGEISFIDQEDIVHYSVLKTGNYRFKFDTNNAESDYRIILYAWNNEKIFDTYYSDEYKEVELKKGEKYKLYIKQLYGFEKYSINIDLI